MPSVSHPPSNIARSLAGGKAYFVQAADDMNMSSLRKMQTMSIRQDLER